MRSPWIIGLFVIAFAVVVYYFTTTGSDGQQDDVAERLRQRQMRESVGSAVVENDVVADEPDWAALEAAGKGVPVPKVLDVRPGEGGMFWFVGYPGEPFGIEIPFGAGRFRTPPAEQEPVHENPGFLGANVCAECHQEKHDSFIHTAHHRTSRLPETEAFGGSFEEGKNVLSTKSPQVAFKMVERDGKFYQRVSYYGWQFEVPMDIIVGSGKLGESYLYWHEDGLYQANVSYAETADGWINSPGYLDGDANYSRSIGSRCVECHFTYADSRGEGNQFTESSFILGVSCERCHGTGEKHVEFHRQNKDEKKGQHISVPTQLSRQGQLDLCGQCHSTVTPAKGEPFAFQPGDRFEDRFEAPDPNEAGNSVHTSNQVARLSLSKCFQETEMACADCHDPHKHERGNKRLFSERCMKCHEVSECGMNDQPVDGLDLAANCVDCHVPVKESERMRMELGSESVFPPLRDHFIRVDRAATKEYLQSLKTVPQ
ncbi:multiheme c-type cytochrome [Stieleria varia]|uniref:Perchlorate reductase subunit gamma n=1 Tax=Stieleria varia TaxID=2528005 RepID=A0A5C6B0Z7_9BACT|nr:multiheme c-type cytochrome [Stieleria varia]TWU05072.1 Perchlorate reductase subunit gamma precursor [Stieleria varia]